MDFMTVVPFKYSNVAPDGQLGDGGFVLITGSVFESADEGGCRHSDCCTCSPGHWKSRIFPRSPDGLVVGYMVKFPDRAELERTDLYDIEHEIAKWIDLPLWRELAVKVQQQFEDSSRQVSQLMSRYGQ